MPDARIRRTERYNLTRFNIDAEFFIVSTFPDLEKIPLDAITLDNSSFRFRRGKEEMVYGQADVLEKLSRVYVTHGRDAWRSIQVVSRHFELLPILHEKVAAANRQRPPSPLGKLPFPPLVHQQTSHAPPPVGTCETPHLQRMSSNSKTMKSE